MTNSPRFTRRPLEAEATLQRLAGIGALVAIVLLLVATVSQL